MLYKFLRLPSVFTVKEIQRIYTYTHTKENFINTHLLSYLAAESCKLATKNFSKDKVQHLSPATICSNTQPLTFTARRSAFEVIYIIYKQEHMHGNVFVKNGRNLIRSLNSPTAGLNEMCEECVGYGR